ncbi:hypothetical protein [Hydrogenimonas sp.]
MEEILATIAVVMLIAPPLGFLAKMIGEWMAKRKIRDVWRGKYR